MAEYIDRDALKDRMAGFVPPFIGESNQAYVDGLTDAYTLICQAPTADVVERKTGKWCADYDYAEYDFDGSTPLPEPLKFQDGWQCSLCGGYSPSETNFCPNCGAKMEVPTDV